MKKTIIALSFVLIILAGALTILSINFVKSLEQSEKSNEYSYTKAICEDGVCQDYVIVCNGSEIISKDPITGASINIPNGWSDPRSEELINGFCEFN